MKTLSFKLISCLMIVWFPLATLPLFAQDWDSSNPSNSNGSTGTGESGSADPFGGDPFGGDPFDGVDTTSSENSSDAEQNNLYGTTNTDNGLSNTNSSGAESSSYGTDQPSYGDTKNSIVSSDNEDERVSHVQNAIIEGVQITTEQGQASDEKIVSGYFIFRDKPTSYFHEVRLREKKMIFEFNDTKTGSSPVPTVSESPIKGFTIEQEKVDANKDVRGLKPEWHDMIRIVFDLEAVPEIHVSDEFSIVSFSFKWTTDPSKIEKYTVKDNRGKIIFFSTAGVGAVAAAAAIYAIVSKPDPQPPLEALPIHDLPIHTVNSAK